MVRASNHLDELVANLNTIPKRDSAEAVVSLILHDLEGNPREGWVAPEWLPARYLTWNRRAL